MIHINIEVSFCMSQTFTVIYSKQMFSFILHACKQFILSCSYLVLSPPAATSCPPAILLLEVCLVLLVDPDISPQGNPSMNIQCMQVFYRTAGQPLPVTPTRHHAPEHPDTSVPLRRDTVTLWSYHLPFLRRVWR